MAQPATDPAPQHSASRPCETNPAGVPTPVQVEVTCIKVYERNPRRGENPEYDRIKASIRDHGLDQPLVITCRPGETEYVVHTGGNTRLRILKQLYEETGEARFYRIQCLLRPWTRESDVLLAHLRENELRGRLIFIDKARAVIEARALLGEELGIRVTQRRLEAELRQAGYSISHSRISQMEYAVGSLLPRIPEALEAGLGKLQVERIRTLERAAGNLWKRYCPEYEGTFDMVFTALCRRYDGPDWDTRILQAALETEIAQEAERSIHAMRTALDAELEGREVTFPEPEPEPSPEPPAGARRDPGPGAADFPLHPDTGTVRAGPGLPRPIRPVLPGSPVPPRDLSYDPVDAGSPVDRVVAMDLPAPDLKTLRSQAWGLAARLARRNGIGDLVLPLPDTGLGFGLCDVPDPGPGEFPGDGYPGQVCTLWWQLAACSEMTVASPASVAPALPLDCALRKALEDQDAASLLERVSLPDPGHTGYLLWRSLHEQDWNDLIRLMDTYRKIHHLAAETGDALWGEAS